MGKDTYNPKARRDAPCHHCEARQPGCHRICLRYAAYQILGAVRQSQYKKEVRAAWDLKLTRRRSREKLAGRKDGQR